MYFLNIDTIIWLEDATRFAPFGTMLVALLAVAIAFWSLLTQKLIARQRATIDFFLKTDLDQQQLDAYGEYIQAREILVKTNSLEEFSQSTHAAKVTRYLNVIELLAVGVRKKVFAEAIAYEYWRDTVISAYVTTQPLIDHWSKKDNSDYSFKQLTWLAKKWSK